ncbi:hypothetical protein EV421DRAFT_2042551 [Armillaria borealis]|uniref:DUF6532 domain-containing protein n=1 Tax=Armillaria borealis TaxID=47425 RepID=A0AA39ISL5_9AGAR|nr:hypothetical protein EV421DRAFT_2042551 [Armillaria borealis]
MARQNVANQSGAATSSRVKRSGKPSQRQSDINENTIATENQKLQACIKQLEKERIKLQQAQVLTDKTNQDLRDRYAEEYRCGHNGRELSDIESEDDDATGTSLDFSSAIHSKGIVSSPPRKLRRKSAPRLVISSPPPAAATQIPHIDFRSIRTSRMMEDKHGSPSPSLDASELFRTDSPMPVTSPQHHEQQADNLSDTQSNSKTQHGGGKRARSPSVTEGPSKAKKARVAEVVAGAKGVNQRDYDGKVRDILHKVCKRWERHIYTVNGYPDDETQRQWLQELWDEACEEASEMYELTAGMKTMIKRRSARVRGAMKTDIKSLVVATYGFVTSNKKATVEQNKKKYVMLATRGAFTCKEPKTRRYRFENKILLMAIIEHFFGHRKAPGIIWEDDFDPIKPETLALIVTIIEHCIEEWADGSYKAQNLNDATQSSRYLAHMSDIKAWCKEDERVTTNIRKLWVAKGRRVFIHLMHADIKPKQESTGYVDDDEKERLCTDLEGRTGETDSEAEDDDDEGGELEPEQNAAGGDTDQA